MIGILITTVIALIFGIILSFLKTNDDKISEVRQLLPGYNCGGCGYGGCDDLACEIIKNPEVYKKCRALRGDNLQKMKDYLKEKYNYED